MGLSGLPVSGWVGPPTLLASREVPKVCLLAAGALQPQPSGAIGLEGS